MPRKTRALFVCPDRSFCICLTCVLACAALFLVVWLHLLQGVGQLPLAYHKQIDVSTLYESRNALFFKRHHFILKQTKTQRKNENDKIIYAITPTYTRLVQKAELTRLSQTLRLVPNLHWILVEDSDRKTELVTNLVKESNLLVTHLTAKTEPIATPNDNQRPHRGIDQRNMGLEWIRKYVDPTLTKGVVYFMDDDNTYSTQLFEEMSQINTVGVWPVGLVGGFNVEMPLIDPDTGKVNGFLSGWEPEREFAIDMAGFAINLKLIFDKPQAQFSYDAKKGYLESEFLKQITSREHLQPLADFCTKVLVWHTKTLNPEIYGIVNGLDV